MDSCTICHKPSTKRVEIYDNGKIVKVYTMCKEHEKTFNNRFDSFFFICTSCKRTYFRFDIGQKPQYTELFDGITLCKTCLKNYLLTNGTPVEYFLSNILLGMEFDDDELGMNRYKEVDEYIIKNDDDFNDVIETCISLIEDDFKEVVVNHFFIDPKSKETIVRIFKRNIKCKKSKKN